MKTIYLDSHATTPMDPRVLEKMMPYLTDQFGNPSSVSHPYGWAADDAAQKARSEVAGLIHADPEDIIFTSGTTESNNLAIKGVAHRYRSEGEHIITCTTEHRSVIEIARVLEQEGYRIDFLPVDEKGQIDLELLKSLICEDTILVSLMAANNETGVIHPLKEIGKMTREKGVLFHCDGAQGVGKIPMDVGEFNIDLLSFSAHKMYGPKGCGALYVSGVDPRVKLKALIDGGGHEKGLRSGTLNVPGIVGLGVACQLAQEELSEDNKRLFYLREKLRKGLFAGLDDIHLNGSLENRLAQNLNVCFNYVEADTLLMKIRDCVAVSSGSSCTSRSIEPSHVLKAMGFSSDRAHSSIRFGLHKFNTEEEIDQTIEIIVKAVMELRKMSPLYTMKKESINIS